MSRRMRQNPIVRTALSRPVTMMMIFASILVLGVVAVVNIPLELIPRGFTAPFISVSVPYSNATPQDIEEKIAKPLEDALSTTPALERITTTSSSSQARVNLELEGDTDMDVVYREVRDRVNRVRPDLPDDVRQVNIRKESGDSMPVVFFGVRWPESMADVAPDIIERHIMRKLERVDGVGLVGAWGEREREIKIEVSRALAEAHSLNIFEIAQTLSQAHFAMASGEVVESDGKFLLRSLAKFGSLQELRDTVVGPNDVRLSDVAEVVYDYPDRDSYGRWNGQPSMAIFVVKESQANTVEVCDRVKEALEEAKLDPALAQFGIQTWFVQGDTIKSSLQQVTDSGMQGGVLAVFVLLFFLRRMRLTVVIALSIPLSMFMAIPVMYFTDQTINLVSLIGLMICIGLVVDNSVVVAENVARYRSRGVGPFAAALHGASEVALPITLATMTTMVVFLPAALLSSGPTQFFMIRMVAPVGVSLMASLFVALILVPLAAAFLLNKEFNPDEATGWRAALLRLDQRWKGVMGWLYESTFGRMRVAYARVLRASLRRRMDVLMVCLLALASLAIPLNPETGVKMAPQGGGGGRQVRINYIIPSDVSLDEADEFFRELEVWMAERRKANKISGEYVEVREGFGQVSIFFDPPQVGDRPYQEVGKEFADAMPVPAGWKKQTRLGESDGGKQSAFPVILYGSDHKDVQAAKEELEDKLVELPGVVGLQAKGRDTSRRDELWLSVDSGLSERLNVSPGLVGNTVAYALRGSPLPRFSGEEREIDVWIRYRKKDREELAGLLEFKVPSTGGVTPIKNVTNTRIEKGDATLVRTNKRVATMISLELDPEARQEAIGTIRSFLASYRLPEGVTFDADEDAREVESQFADLAKALALGAVFIFLIMGFLFESFVLPLSVLPSMPLSLIGVYWFLYLTDSHIDALAGVGLMLLIGVVVNNAIVLVDFINSARAQGLERSEAIVQAGVQRFRPIFMTALTTVGGMLPLAFAQAPPEGIPYNAFGRTLVGGMTTATILTLVVVPVCYTLFDDLRDVVRAWFARNFRA